jgi:hypothetical protein
MDRLSFRCINRSIGYSTRRSRVPWNELSHVADWRTTTTTTTATGDLQRQMTPAQTSVLQSARHSSAITEQCCRPVEVAQHQQVPMPGHVRFTQNPETTSSLLLVPPPTLSLRSSVRVCSVAAVLFLGVLSIPPTSRPSSPAAYKYRMAMCQKKKDKSICVAMCSSTRQSMHTI